MSVVLTEVTVQFRDLFQEIVEVFINKESERLGSMATAEEKSLTDEFHSEHHIPNDEI